ncbi:MAG: hypothetical protein R3C62_02615 [Chloroflexota bacterium]
MKREQKPVNKPPVAGKHPTQRIRPGTRAVNREAKNVARPMPQPPARRPLAKPAATAAAARALSEEQKAQVARLEREFEQAEKQSQLSAIYDDIGKFDSKLVEYPLAVDGLRARGYVHSGQLEDQIEALDDKWDAVRPRVESALQMQVRRLDSQLNLAERQVSQMGSLAGIKGAETAVSALSTQVSAAERAVSGLYQGLENELDSIGSRLSNLGKMLDLYEGSPEIRLYEAEGPLLAVEAEWEQDGDEGPDGYLFLTDQRLIFEQREEVVTKRRFGIFKAESEKIQKVLIEVQAHEIEQVSHKEEGGFLGMGKADILELVFAPAAPVTRARFHLKGQDSSDWAAMIKRVQTGEIDRDRAEEYLDDVEAAKVVAASFPTTCPACFAAVAPPPRGATSVTCEFCSTVILPQAAA